jgi:hypothetical protein
MATKVKPVAQLSEEDYGSFISGLELQNVLLVEMRAKRIDFPQTDAELGVEVKSFKPKCRRYKDGFTVTATFEIYVTQSLVNEGIDVGEASVFGSFRVAFELAYTSVIPLDDAIFEIFKQNNLLLNIWPYVRQSVHQQSVLMGLPALVLPVHRSN